MIAPLEPAGGSPVRKPKHQVSLSDPFDDTAFPTGSQCPSCKPSAAPPADSVPTEQIEKLKERFLAALKELSHQGKIFCDHTVNFHARCAFKKLQFRAKGSTLTLLFVK